MCNKKATATITTVNSPSAPVESFSIYFWGAKNFCELSQNKFILNKTLPINSLADTKKQAVA